MTKHVVVGEGWAFEQACGLAREVMSSSAFLPFTSLDGYNFDIAALLQEYSPTETEVFVALDERAVNYSRQKLIAEVRLVGYRTFNLISPRANVDGSSRLMGNIYIGDSSTVAAGCVIGMGSWLDRRVTLDSEVKLGSCVTLRAAVTLSRQVEVGSGSTLGVGTLADERTLVGKHCEWLLGGRLPATLADRSFYDSLMPEGARVLAMGRVT